MNTRGPEISLEWTDPLSGTSGYLVIDTFVEGLTAGGCRMRPGVTRLEVTRLAQVMTLKFSLFRIPIGGAKCGVDHDPASPDAPEVLSRFFGAIRPYLQEHYLTGQDMGTTENLIVATLADNGIHSLARPARERWGISQDVERRVARVFAQVKVDGNQPIQNVIAGFGTSQCALEGLEFRGISPGEATASVQGFGNVGGAAAFYLHRAGVRVVALADILGSIVCEEGLDVPFLLERRDRYGTIPREGLPPSYRLEDGTSWMTQPCDVLVPAAIADAINEHNAGLVSAPLVVEGANLPVTAAAEGILRQRGTAVIPDFLANSAFALVYGAVLMEQVGEDPGEILALVSTRLRSLTRQVLESFGRGELPRQAATRIAADNLEEFRRVSPGLLKT